MVRWMKFLEDIQDSITLAGETGRFYSCINLPVIIESLVDPMIFPHYTFPDNYSELFLPQYNFIVEN